MRICGKGLSSGLARGGGGTYCVSTSSAWANREMLQLAPRSSVLLFAHANVPFEVPDALEAVGQDGIGDHVNTAEPLCFLLEDGLHNEVHCPIGQRRVAHKGGLCVHTCPSRTRDIWEEACNDWSRSMHAAQSICIFAKRRPLPETVEIARGWSTVRRAILWRAIVDGMLEEDKMARMVCVDGDTAGLAWAYAYACTLVGERRLIPRERNLTYLSASTAEDEAE
ncbi:hypothetical protein K505DRAFT_342256 [Melanomma pulvis-pyrius CBS 109.77]|uniref:Uncharacterized protein n=1 Tax=Melanomma pulvis-pyrius CBS 109.77 TaxID=1314802 RepID=A0A6A6WWF8_9PLEO|nr:hypothetical protein K505DRAFT_342256 [Melanomma pulvis-pyrius CBS 109.77]